MRLEQLIERHYDQMTASDHLIWQYLRKNREECKTMSLQQLADACQVSHTSILRFVQRLGMDGFTELKVFLKWEEHQPFHLDMDAVKKDSFDLSRTLSLTEQTDFSEIFARMEQAKNIYAYGSGSIQKAATKALRNFSIINGKLVHVIEGQEERRLSLQCMQPGDVTVLYSVSGNNPHMNAFAREMKAKGLYLVAICQDGANELAGLCDFHIPFYTQRFQVGRYGTQFFSSAGMFVITELMMLKYAVYQTERAKDDPDR